MNKRYNIFQKLISLVLSLVMVLGLLPAVANTANAAVSAPDYVANSKKADPQTIDWEDYFGPNKLDTELAGAVWSDKSVFTGATDELPGITLKDSDNFLIALSTMASNMTITGHSSAPTDTMLVLDLSGSMVDDTVDVGYVRWGNNYREVRGIDTAIMEALVDSTNNVIKSLMAQNDNNRVGVVLYSGNTSTNQAATANSATVVLPLGRYTGVDGEYLSLSAPTTTATVYEWVRSGWGNNGSWQEAGEATYVPENTSITVSVKTGLTTEAGGDVASASKTVVGGTYIQNGLYKAMNEFLAVTDTTVPEGNANAGAERLPVLVLMTDGAPTIATTSYTSIGDSNIGNGGSTNDQITFLTQLTAAYVRGQVAAKYKENENDEAEMLFLTLGLGTENSTEATNTLYPAGNGETLQSYWNNYFAASNGNSVDVISGEGTLNVTRNSYVEAMNYVDKYFYATNAQGLIDSFDDIIGEIELKAASYATLVTGGNADLSGYVTFEDELGELMQVHDMKGIVLGSNRFTGIEIAKDMSTGVLGTTDAPTELGDELIRTIKERIPGTTTTQAQQLVAAAYADQQLYYESDSAWSNYIGWYADAQGNYVGFWDKDSGYAPYEGATYANKSYGYLGVNGDSNMMHVVVMVRTNLKTLHQTVFFKVPAALLPMVTYKVTLAENDPSQVESFQRTGAEPIQLVFEVGLRSDINAVNLEAKVAEHIANGGHVHRAADGSVELFTNSWAIGNDLNNNGVPDPEEVDSAVVAESHFHPALENSRYYFTEDTLVLDANGDPVTGDTQPSGTGYHHDYYIYSANGRTTVDRALSATTLSKTQKNVNGQWYVPAGTAYRELPRMRNYKTENSTNTLDYSDYPAVFADENIDVYSFLGNNGTVRITPATGFTLNKQVDGTIDGVSEYTFRVTLSNIPAGATVSPVLTDANGDALAGVTMSAVENNQFTVTMPADVTAYISGIPVGTNVTIAEIIDGDYKVTGISVAGAAQTGEAQFAIPAYSANVEQMIPISFTNAPNGYGDLVIEKDVTHSLVTDPAALADKEFTFQVKLVGSKISAGQTYETSTNVDVKVGADGYLTYTDGSAIVLKNEQSITIYDLPEGTTYTVTEQDIPGFQVESVNGQNVTQASGVIAANEEEIAAFVNRYPDEFTPVNVPLEVTVSKILNAITPYTGNEEFVFVLQMLLADGTYPDIAADNGEKYLKVSANGSAEGKWTLTFDDLGTYYFRIVERKPSQQTPAGTDTPGMDYSTQQALFEVNVTDQDMDGVLEIAVKEEAHITVSGAYTDSDPEKITGITGTTSFTNTYELGSTSTTLDVRKTLKNTTGVDKHLTDFHFALTPVDAEGNVLAGAQSQSVTTSALGEATFNIFLDQAGTYYYKVAEVIPAGATLDTNSGKYVLNGMYYDPTEYLLTVVATPDLNGDLQVDSQTLTVKGVSVTNQVATFENEYVLNEVSVDIPVRKNFSGRPLSAGETFSFRLDRTDAAYVPLTDKQAYSATKETAGTAQFGLTFTAAGVYHYKLVESIPAGAQDNMFEGVRYDTAVYHITITVTDDGKGGLEATRVIHKVGQTDTFTEALFSNVYEITGSGSVIIRGKKTLNGRALIPGEFTFGLYDNAACTGTPIATVSNGADGTFAFPEMLYNADEHLGTNNAEKIYTYYVKEVPGDKGGVTYNETVHTVTVTVSHDKGVLTVTPSDNYNAISIVNTYAADGIDVQLSGAKLLSGDWSKVSAANKQFTFELYQTGADFLVTGDPIDTKTVEGAGQFTFTRSFIDGQEGYYYFVIKEDTSAQAGGVGYDAGEYHITVNVSDPGDGKLMATVTMYRPGTGNTNTAVFTNAYAAEPVELTLIGTKKYTDVSTNQPKAMTEGQFQFVVLEGNEVVTTGKNKTDGTIEFLPIRYTSAGEHTYTVVEAEGDLGGVSYDDAVFTVGVSVVDNGNGTLTATANYGGKTIAFENTYNPGMTSVTLEGTKLLTGKDMNAGDFTFEVYEGNTLVAEGTNSSAADGVASTIVFEKIEYTASGDHTYTVVEKNEGKGGIGYDDAVFTVTVSVVDNGDGTLTATVNYGGTAIAFENTYTVAPTDITLEGTKELTGKDQSAGDFTFEVYEGNTLVAEGTNSSAADGVASAIVFDKITYTAAGNHTYTVVEKNEGKGGIGYDDAVFTVTVSVVDNGDGTLTATANYGGTAIAFENTYSVAPTDITLEGEKKLTGRDQIAGEFTFEVYEGSALVAEGKNNADGTIVFEKIEYTAAGEHTYTVKEVKGDISGVSYDEAAFTVTVQVVDNGDGTLTATPTYAEEILFENTYAAAAVELNLKAEKTLTGRELENGEFTFKIFEGEKAVATGTNKADGTVTFSPITYDKVGTYTYTVKEIKGNVSYVIYDDAVYTITVKVTDPGDGQLAAQVYAGNTEITDGVVGSFANEFAPPATPVTGDTTNLPLMATITALSGAAIIFLAVLVIAEDKKKKVCAN